MKKGQITIFIILAILVLLAAGTLIYLSVSIKTENIKVEQEKVTQSLAEAGQIKLFIENCLEESTHRGLKEISLNGGYINVPNPLIFQDNSLWFINQINVQPTLGQIKVNFQDFIKEDLKNCLNYSMFVQQGFNITEHTLESEITFGRTNIISTLNYEIVLEKGNFIKEFKTFTIEVPVAFRELFETASKIINLQLNPDFKEFYPLEKLNVSLVETNYFQPEQRYLVYEVREKESKVQEDYPLRFASKFGISNLIKRIKLQENSNRVGTHFPLQLISIDNFAKLIILPGTTLNLNDESIPEITIQQRYPENVTRENVPFQENLDDSVEYEDLTWNLSYPIYHFEPTGMRFNTPQRLVLYWDENNIPHEGNMGILFTEGDGWRPLPSKTDYENHYVYTDIPGFSEFTAADCGKQNKKSVSTSAKINPGAGCIGKLIAMIILIAIITAIIILSAGAASPITVGMTAAAEAAAAEGATAGTVIVATETAALGAGATAAEATALAAEAGTLFSTVGASTLAASATTAATGTALVTGAGSIAAGTGFFSTVGAIFTGGLTLAGYSIAIGGALVGGFFLNAALGFDSGADSITFTPLCDQNITILLSEHGGEGMCTPSGTIGIGAGEITTLSSSVKKCSFIRAMFCVECSINCKAKYK